LPVRCAIAGQSSRRKTPKGMDITEVVAVSLAAVAGWCDVRTRRIPNILTFGGAALAIVYSVVTHGAGGLVISIGGWFTGALLFLPMYLLGGMGAGDVKLIACMGAWLGPHDALFTALYSSIAGGAMAVVVAVATGYLGEAFRNLWLLFAHWRVVGVRPLAELTLEQSRSPRLPYALPIAAGTVAAIWLR
jgi:prepilin peptidase CpaA